MAEILFEKESYELIGLCMEVHRQLGPGFNEAIYKEALEIELTNHNIQYEREKCFLVDYKGHTLRKSYNADLVVYGAIILEAKAVSAIIDKFIGITINYLRASGLRLGIIANFGEKSFQYKRVLFGEYQISG
jgi:GxxExxY protein